MNIKIKRKKSFVGMLIPYHCIINYDLKDFRDYIIQENHVLAEDYLKEMYLGISKRRHFDMERFLSYLGKNNLADTVKIIKIKNGKTINVETDNSLRIFPVAFTSTGAAFGNQICINSDNIEKLYIIKTKYVMAGTSLTISDATK